MIFSEVAMTVYLLPQPLEHSCGKLKWLNKKRSRHSFLTVFILLFGLSNQIFMFQCSTLHKCSWTFSSVFFYDLPQRAFVQNVWGTLSHNGRKNRTDSSVLVWNGTARVLPIFQEICLCPSIPSAKISLLFSEISPVNWPAFNSNQSFSICSRSKVVISYPTKITSLWTVRSLFELFGFDVKFVLKQTLLVREDTWLAAREAMALPDNALRRCLETNLREIAFLKLATVLYTSPALYATSWS